VILDARLRTVTRGMADEDAESSEKNESKQGDSHGSSGAANVPAAPHTLSPAR
jgi:hypothetical protein